MMTACIRQRIDKIVNSQDKLFLIFETNVEVRKEIKLSTIFERDTNF